MILLEILRLNQMICVCHTNPT